ncbi:MAG: CoA transferase [Deltaproteobacteria bacterium]|nr:CoA transferase [Deltaproteobacteria bacterium]MBW2420995.1 CoA transferase [Deltaproteobacteria bacterium]
MLSAYRVLDLSDESGLLCGQILADLGADVIQIEPRAGSPARRLAPRRTHEASGEARGEASGGAQDEGSLFWAAYTRNKRSLALDLESAADRGLLLGLAAGADFWIECERPGRMAELGLGYEELASIQPGIVYVSITPFGQTGPKAHWRGRDLTQVAAGGFAYLSGDADGPPTRVRVPQAHAQAGADAAVGALIAHHQRRRSGRGQHVDVSAQQSVTLANMYRTLDAAVGMAPAQRIAGGLQAGGVLIPIRHRCRDGWVTLGPAVLPSTGHFMQRLLAWAAEEGFCEPALAEEDWGSFGLRIGAGQLPPNAYEPVQSALDAFFADKTHAEVMRAAVERRLLVAPVLGVDEIVESEQLAERGYAVTVAREGEGGDRDRYPGPFAKFGRAPIRYRRPPPRLDEHGAELRAEAPRRPAPCGSEPADSLPLAGVKILDLFWVIAGPAATRMLADYGATVVRVESSKKLDTLRVSPPWQHTQPHPEGAAGFQSANANKLGITLDLSQEAGREIVRDLTRWADVVTESFAPGVMAARGLGWEQLRRIKPDLVMLSSCIMGQTGPWRDFTGFGRLAVSLAGFQPLASWPGRPPSGPFGAYTDAIAARYNALAILAALEYRERTGEGQYIDLSQTEAALHFLAPAFLDWSVNGQVEGPAGNEDDACFPHGMFPSAGEDRWVAIAVGEEEEWRALCEVMGRRDLLERRKERNTVEDALAAWTRPREAGEIEEALQARGVPAHAALDTPGLYADPQLRHRGHFIEIAHDIYGTTTVESSRLRLSRSPARTPERALSLGRDNRHVLESLLGYSPARVAELEAAGALA